MYSMLEALFLLAVIAALKGRWWLMGLAQAALLWTHSYGAFYALAAALVGALQLRRSGFLAALRGSDGKGFLLANTLAGLSWLPWLLVLRSQIGEHFGGIGFWIQPITLGSWLFPFYMLWWGFDFPAGLQVHASLAVYLLLAFGAFKAIRTRRRAPALLLGLVLLVPLLAGLVSVAWQPVLLFRALAGVSIPFYMLAAWTLTDWVDRTGRQLAASALLPLLLLGVVGYYRALPLLKPDPRPEFSVIERGWQAGDVVYHANSGSMVEWHAYAPPAWTRLMMPEPVDHTPGTMSRRTREAFGIAEARLEDIEWRRAWFVWKFPPTISRADEGAARDLLARYPSRLVEVLDHDQWGQVNAAIYLLENPSWTSK